MSEDKKPQLHPVSVHIKNFQSIEDLDIEIRGFTCITGKTNIGKSAIMRAMSSAILGDPVMGMVRKGASYCSVEMASDGWGFRWEKGEKGINRYIIGGVTYDKPGQKQLDEVAKMGFSSVKLGSKEVQPWWAPQFFPIFLLGETGPAVTDFISEVSRLTVLQDAVVLSSRGKRHANDEAKGKADEASKMREKLTRVAGLEMLTKLEKELDEQQDSIREYEGRIYLGESLSEKLEIHTRRVTVLARAEEAQVPEDVVGELVGKLAAMHGFWQRMEASARKIIAMKPSEKVSVPSLPVNEYERFVEVRKFSGIGKLRDRVHSLEKVRQATVPAGQEALEALQHAQAGGAIEKRLSGLQKRVRTAESLLGKVTVPSLPEGLEDVKKGERLALRLVAIQQQEDTVTARLKETEKELRLLDKQIEAIPSCPSCGRPVASGDHKADKHHARASA